jgi:hypothetical protein
MLGSGWSKNRLCESKLEKALDHLLNSEKEIKKVLKYAHKVELGSEVVRVFDNLKLAESQLKDILEKAKNLEN